MYWNCVAIVIAREMDFIFLSSLHCTLNFTFDLPLEEYLPELEVMDVIHMQTY